MKENKFVIVTGACMFLLLMMILFNFGGGSKVTYSATYKCENSSHVHVSGTNYCCPSSYNLVDGVCCLNGYDTIADNGMCYSTSQNGHSAKREPSKYILIDDSTSEDSTPDRGEKCENGTPDATLGCKSCNAGYHIEETTDAYGTVNTCAPCEGNTYSTSGNTATSCQTCPAGQEPNATKTGCVDITTTGYCYKCYNSTGSVVQQVWSATNKDSVVVGTACGPTDNRGTWSAGTQSTESACPKKEASSKITPRISASLSKTSGVTGTTGTVTVTVTDVATCPGTISIRNSYGMEINGKSTFETKSITSNGPHSFNFKVIGEGGKKGSILVSYTPNDTNKCTQPNNEFAEFTINISETDTRTQSTLTIANKSGVASMAKGDSSYLLIGANTTGMLYVSVGDSTVASFTFDEGNSAIEELRVSERATIKALKVGETTINIEFVPSDTTKYTNASASVPVKVVAGTSDGYACYECKNKNGTIDREWQKDTSSLGTCSEDTWVKLTTSYNECTDVQGMCYRCNNSGVYKWSVTTLSGAANPNDKECASGWAFIKYTNDSSDCKGSSSSNNNGGSNNNGNTGGDNTGGNSNTGGNNNGNNTTTNPQTGNIMLFVVWVIGFGVIAYSFWYFKNLNRNGA